ncbi:MAG: bifunctional (p)ppGpp synthetase/guanosine-3',5'-bis(diphosphate) 3'-pyrophosphohydrolase [Candidatus Lokiarchaeota archaeon]|nr:bifunctional (p)ppGpp synthetase/guanosine-3',5'-bis(diphosphate) 3'-pyrophosphohydrolase [Candidatus Lokiarchaeota archaeon]
MGLIQEAAAYAKEKHDASKPRKFTNQPYFVHPEAVAKRLEGLLARDLSSGKLARAEYDSIMAAAYLHDVVEDCGVPIEEIETRFGSTIAKMVAELTSDKKAIATMMQQKQWDKHQAKGVYLSAEINHMDAHTRQIKLADREDNVRELAVLDKVDEHRAWVRGYARETRYILDHLAFTPTAIEQELVASIKALIAPFLNEA